MRAINASVMRQVNRTLILNRIRMRPISRAELAEETRLTRASVTQIVEELINDALVIETSMVERSRLGRRSTQLAINPGAGVIFGVTLRPLECTVGASDMLGRVLTRNIEVVNGREPGEVLDAVAGVINHQMAALNANPKQSFGIGVSVPGGVEPKRGTLQGVAGMESWKSCSLKRELSQRTGMKVHVESAASAQALEQKYFGGAGDNFALVRMEESLSVGIVVRDALYRGAPGFNADLRQSPADPEGRQTLNQLLAGEERRNWRRMLESPDTPENERAMLQLAYPLASVMCAYQVKRAVLGGDVGERMRPMQAKLLQRVRELMPEPVSAEVTLSIAESDPVRMAVAAAYDRIFQTELGSSCCRV